MNREKLIVANWKMNSCIKEVSSFFKKFFQQDLSTKARLVICPSFVYLNDVKEKIGATNLFLGAQNMHYEKKGAYTGEISPVMLNDIGCRYVIIGHSERRKIFFENDSLISKKVKSAIEHGIIPILCVGETEIERKNEKTMSVISEQLNTTLEILTKDDLSKLIIAYEPVWAIGTGLTATPSQVLEVHSFIREKIKKIDAVIANNLLILYGGSVKSSNAKELFLLDDIDGALVGGASLDPEEFRKICELIM